MGALIGWRVWLVALALSLAACTLQTLRLSAAELQVAQLHAEIARMQHDAEAAALAQSEAARQIETERAVEAERISHETQKRIALADGRARAAVRAAAGLRDEIARLNARPAPEDAGAAALAHEAGVARELLGTCAAEYQGLAAEADGLRDQVMGLQDYATRVAKAGD